MSLYLEIFSLIIVFISLINILIQQRSFWIIFFLALLFFAISLFLIEYWSLKLTASILISGWMTSAMFAVTVLTQPQETHASQFTSNIFTLILSVLSVLLVLAAYPLLNVWFISASPRLLVSALALIAVGGIMLSLSEEVLKILTGYLCVLMGFILFYSQLENSALVVSLLSAVVLAFALIGSYLLLEPETMESTE